MSGQSLQNVQIFGTKKCSDSRKAERFFKDRGIKFHAVDLAQKGMSPGELRGVAARVGGVEQLIDRDGKRYLDRGLKYAAPTGPRILIRGGYIVTQDPKLGQLRGDVLVDNGKITAIGKNLQALMFHSDARITNPPSPNTVIRIHQLCIRFRQIMNTRMVPEGKGQRYIEVAHGNPERRVFLTYPTPYFGVRNKWMQEYCGLVLLSRNPDDAVSLAAPQPATHPDDC